MALREEVRASYKDFWAQMIIRSRGMHAAFEKNQLVCEKEQGKFFCLMEECASDACCEQGWAVDVLDIVGGRRG